MSAARLVKAWTALCLTQRAPVACRIVPCTVVTNTAVRGVITGSVVAASLEAVIGLTLTVA